MSDFSAFALFTAGLALLATPAVAQISVPGGSDPTAGAVTKPGLNETVAAGSAYPITWKAVTTGCGSTVDLVLLKGPSSNQMAPLEYIVKGTENSGSYSWTPAKTLAPAQSDYGIELICVDSQAYQYSTRFGLSNDDFSGSSSSSGSSSPTTPKYPVGTGSGSGYSNGTEPKATGTGSPNTLFPSTVTSTAGSGSSTRTSGSGASGSSSTSTPGAAVNVKATVGSVAAAAAAAMAVFAL